MSHLRLFKKELMPQWTFRAL